ncbi:hypothetical protein KDH_71360 [Dictyobacter sp. S3.2.2.5]|uniref:Lantibiotic biosynthesis protein dehydration domain-containing protein n=1 Tax=Dictyobacter halimunensis TaxID=3026934 RepID=A0ABQ6G6T3_9CHLR|nr:hypothetical protein KDH_71360 [Dictyobacter sp. S3.2.2.5]
MPYFQSDLYDARPATGATTSRQASALPIENAEVLASLARLTHETGDPDKTQWAFIDAAVPYPFEELLAPFVAIAQQRYQERAGHAYARLAAQAHLALQRHLLQVLTSLSVPTLHAEFARAYAEIRSLPAGQQLDERGFYTLFIGQMYRGGLAAVLERYPVLAELLATTSNHWLEASCEFLARLDADWPLLQQTFGTDQITGPVTTLAPALSDPHNGRRMVMALTFASGYKLVYKPRNVGMEESFYYLLSWCNARGLATPFKVLTVVNRVRYGWMEFVAYEPCQDQQAVHRYYHRAGMLLCLTYMLGGFNGTHEHVIAHGEHPMLVDAGMLLHAYPCPDHLNQERRERCSDWEAQAYSVSHTGFLANWLSLLNSPRATDVSMSGILYAYKAKSSDGAQKSLYSSSIALKYGSLRSREHLNVPASGDALPEPEVYQADIVAGFQHCYLFLLAQQEAMLRPDGPLLQFKHQPARFIYRPGWEYSSVLPRLIAPENLRDEGDRTVLLEPLRRDAVPTEYHIWEKSTSPAWDQACGHEQQALLRGDIPFFTAYTDATTLTCDDQEIEYCFHQPAFDLMLARLRAMSQADMTGQSGYIQQTLNTLAISRSLAREPRNSQQEAEPASLSDEAMVSLLKEEARGIAEQLVQQAIRLPDRSATWLTTNFLLRSQHYHLQPMGFSLFDGVSGVALFLAAAARAFGEDRYRELALAAVRPLRQRARDDADLLMREMGIGGGIGLGSVVYALTKAGQFLDEPQLLADASLFASLITPESIHDEHALDIIAGSSGALLGLLTLYEVSREQRILDTAMLCARHLLQARTRGQADCLAWPTLRGEHNTGFAHGIAGIVYALTRLYAVTGDSELLAASREALLYEDRAFVSEKGNWPDVIGGGKSGIMSTWCHGAPGIGLARLGGLPELDSAHIRADIEAALRTTQRIRLEHLDFLCCGNLGRVDLLFTASRQLERPELTHAALHQTRQLIARARSQGRFNLHIAFPGITIPNFFHGVSGIGYQFLRLADPQAFPSALLWK